MPFEHSGQLAPCTPKCRTTSVLQLVGHCWPLDLRVLHCPFILDSGLGPGPGPKLGDISDVCPAQVAPRGTCTVWSWGGSALGEPGRRGRALKRFPCIQSGKVIFIGVLCAFPYTKRQMDNRGALGWLEGRAGVGLNRPFTPLPPFHLGQAGSVQLLLWDLFSLRVPPAGSTLS